MIEDQMDVFFHWISHQLFSLKKTSAHAEFFVFLSIKVHFFSSLARPFLP